MKGIQHIEIFNRAAKYKFDLYRNITIVRGNSGTGKTTLFNMISDHTRLGDASGVTISSPKKCVALIDTDWEHQLSHTSDSIVFIDEGSDFITSQEFASAIKGSDNYYVIFNREGLHNLPYSVEEIYKIKTSGEFHRFEKMYKTSGSYLYGKKGKGYNVLVTEDSNSGFQFFESLFNDSNVECKSSEGNSNIINCLKKLTNDKTFIIADGAAFGSEIDRVLKWQQANPNKLIVCLPESFEWLILSSGLIKNNDIEEILNNTSEYADGKDYFSWENFFTDYLEKATKNTVFAYKKKKLNKVYINESNSKKIIALIAEVLW